MCRTNFARRIGGTLGTLCVPFLTFLSEGEAWAVEADSAAEDQVSAVEADSAPEQDDAPEDQDDAPEDQDGAPEDQDSAHALADEARARADEARADEARARADEARARADEAKAKADEAKAKADEAKAKADEARARADEAKAEAEEEGEGRFRFGVSAMGGPMTGAYSGGAGGLDVRLGHQINNTLGLYAQPVGLLGAGASVDFSGARASGLGLFGVGFLLEANPIDLLYFALGPEYLTGVLGVASASASPSSSSASADGRLETGPFFSLAGRAGVAIGSTEEDRRNAFTIGIDWRVVFAPGGPAVLPLLALGFDAF